MEPLKLLTWMATNRDPRFLENVIYALEKHTGRKVGTVYYMYGSSPETRRKVYGKLSDVQKYPRFSHINIVPIDAGVMDVDNHNQVISHVIKALDPIRHDMGEICVNISSGTNTMGTIWMVLKAMDFFQGKATYYSAKKYSSSIRDSSQDVVPKEEQPIEEIEFSLDNSYLKLIEKIKKGNPSDALLGTNSLLKARQTAFEKLSKFAAFENVPLFLLGERGVGKSSTVKHIVTRLKGKNLVEAVCGAFDTGLVDSILFGHKKGAFTGATQDHVGLIEQANGGILFLDEIQDLPRSTQRKLLQTIQEKDHPYTPLGSKKPQSADVQFIFASNKDFKDLQEKLDPDFLDRITMFTIRIPSLRECKEDIRDDWQSVWDSCRPQDSKRKKISTTVPETAPWNDSLQKFFNQDINLMGNIRSLQKVACQIQAWEAWDNPQKQNEILSEIEEENRRRNTPTGTAETAHKEFAIEDFPEFQESSWKDAEVRFKKSLANWAHKNYGTWEKAAETLKCTPETLMKIAK